jgi:hypothetical protein
MSNTSPWFKPYDHFLMQLHQRFGGELISPSGIESAFAADTDGLSRIDHPLPSLKSAIEGIPLFIEVSGDYLLHIHISHPLTTSFKIRSRGFMDRVQSFIGIGGAVKSGNSCFDRRFATDTDARDDSGLLRVAEVQEIILSLVPFVLLEVHIGGIHFSRDIASDEDLSFPETESTIISLHRFVVLANSVS